MLTTLMDIFEDLLKNHLIAGLLQVGLILVVALIFYSIGKKFIKKIIYTKTKKLNFINQDQVPTALTIANSIWKYLVLFLSTMAILSVLGLNVAVNSILATAGIGGIALSFSAQSFIKDIFSGISILTENIFCVGEVIEIEGKKGTVISLSLRTTKLLCIDGEVFIFPNGLIGQVTNFSRGTPTAYSYVYITDPTQVDLALSCLNSLCAAFSSPLILKAPVVLGVSAISPTSIRITVSCECLPNNLYKVRRALNKDIIDALNDKGVSFQKNLMILDEKNP